MNAIPSMSKKELISLYNVSYKTFQKWLLSVPGIIPEEIKCRKIFTPHETLLIITHLGDPR